MNKQIAVTGAASFIGAALHRYCETHGIGWTGVDLAPAGPHHALSRDITAPGWADGLPDGLDALVHLAAISRTPDCRRDPARAIAVNVTGVWRVIEAARARGIGQIVFASSEWVYGDAPGAGVRDEDSPIDAASITGEYALTKLAGERLLAMAAGPELAATVLRFGIVYGPRPSEGWSAVESMHDAVARRDSIEVGSLATARRFVHVDDIASGIAAALERRPTGFSVFNLTGNRLVSLGDIIAESSRLQRRAPAVAERTPESPSVRDIDNAKARRELGWSPRIELADGLTSLGLAVAAAPAGDLAGVRR